MHPYGSPESAAAEEIRIFANPIAGRGLGASIAERLQTRLTTQGYRVQTSLKRAGELTQEELGSPARAAIVIGGDGTLRGVAERLIEGDAISPLLPVPLGTANLMGKHLGIAWNPTNLEDQVCAAVDRNRVRMLDAGRANGRLFLLMTGIGFDAQIVEWLDRLRRGPIQFWDYLIPSALSLRDFPAASLRVELDGREVFPLAPALAFVGNLREYGTGFPVTPHAKSDDGLLDLCVLPCRSHAELIQLFLSAAAGEHTRGEGVVYQRGRHVSIESPTAVAVQVDGDPAGHTPVRIDLLPIQLPFIVP